MAEILIIDDNDAILHVMSRILQKQGYAVAAAKTGREAIDKISRKPFNLAIVDLNLPDINGIELQKIIRARSATTKTIILTGLPPQKSEETASSGEPIRILMKPLTAEELISEVRQALNNKP